MRPMTPTRTQTAFRGLLAARTLGALADGAMLPFVILWARRDAGFGGPATGLLFVALAVGELSGGLAGGVLADRLGHRRVVLISTAGMALGYGSLFAAHQPWTAVAALFIAGCFESAFHPTIAALIGDLKAGPDLPKAFGQARVGANVGRIAGPLIGAAVAAVSLRAVFTAAGLLLVCAFVALAVTLPKDRATSVESDDAEPEGSPAGLATLFRDTRLGMLVAAGGLLSITFTWWEADGLVLLRAQHPLSTTAYASLFAIAAAATIALQIPVTRWTRRLSISRLLFLGAGAQALGLAVFAAASLGFGALVAAALIIAAGQMLYSPAVSTFVARRASPGQGATYQAAISTTEDIGTAVGPTTGLALGGLGDPRLVWLLAAPLCLAAGFASARAARRGNDPVSSPAEHPIAQRQPV